MASITTSLEDAAARLKAGQVVAIPTETVYGLAASIRDPSAVRRIFEVKRRPFFDPLIVHVASVAQARTVVREWPRCAGVLAAAFWPGPLTLVLPKCDDVDPLITAGLDTVGVRIPARDETRRLIEMVGAPLAAPSANRFGRTSPTTAAHVLDEFPGEDLAVLDAGPSEVGVESTVVALRDVDRGAEVHILRPGGVPREAIAAALAGLPGPVRVERVKSAASPGHLEHHYQPERPLLILHTGPIEDQVKTLGSLPEWKHLDPSRVARLVLPADPAIAARTVYGEMRRLAASGAQALVVQRDSAHSGGLWEAVWDRLERAATADLSGRSGD